MGIWWPTITNRQILEAEVGEKGKRSLVKCYTIWENGKLLTQSPSPPGKPEKSQPPSVRPKPKAAWRFPSSLLNTTPWEPQSAAEWSSRQLAFLSAIVSFRLPPGAQMWGQCHQWPCDLQDQKVPRMYLPVCHKVGKSPVPSFPWVCICLPTCVGPSALLTQTSTQSGRAHPPSNLFSSPG